MVGSAECQCYLRVLPAKFLKTASETVLGILLFFAEYGPALLIWLAMLALPVIVIWRRYSQDKRHRVDQIFGGETSKRLLKVFQLCSRRNHVRRLVNNLQQVRLLGHA